MEGEVVMERVESVQEGGTILHGQKKHSRRFEVGASGIRAIRERTSLSQSEFARLIGVSVKTLQNWEQDRRRPTGPAATLLRIIAYDPRLAVKASQKYLKFESHRPSVRRSSSLDKIGGPATDGTLRKAFFEPACFCIPLLRPHRH